jgi:adenylate cyclase
MADIFISYSSKDREKAEQLTELLSSAGLSVWIDKHGIGAATSWTKEIVDGINNCKALLLLLSSSSIASQNVIKEVSLASEKQKKIIPLDLEPVTIPAELEYQLAGLQRTSMTNIDAIIRALGFEATQAPTMKLVKETDGRKSLMILPFEDLSPTADNGWFADGIVSEMISLLSNVKALKLTDAQTTKEFKNFKGHLAVYAREMGIRYFVQGDVRKFGDAIKITSRLLDIETGDHLWQDSLKGTMDDIFDIQEQVAQKVLEAMKIHLVQSELDKLGERGTENAEAYELLMKAKQHVGSNTRQDFEESIRLCTEALALDPNYAEACSTRAAVLAQLFRVYNPDQKLLDEAIKYAKRAISLKPTLWGVNGIFSHIFMLQGKIDDAVKAAEEYIRNSPNDFSAHFTLGFLYDNTENQAKAISPYEEAHRIKPDDLNVIMNLVNCYSAVGDTEKTIGLA